MGELEFILQGDSFPVNKLEALQSCDGLSHRLQGNQLFINFDVTADVLRLFISAVHGEAIELTNENIDGLSTLCNEFQFLSLSGHLEVFKNTRIYQLEQRFNALKAKLQSLEERMQQHDGGIRALQADLSRQLRVEESIEQRIGTEAELASHRANEVEKVRNGLREVRELAEGAQRKAESTEVQLGRVGRLEAEVSALRIRVCVLPPSGWIPRSFLTFRSTSRIAMQNTLLFCGATSATVSVRVTFTAAVTGTRTH
jgi:DNA mismatch repair ATPase MutS